MPDKNDFSEIISECLRSQARANEIITRIDSSMERMEAGQERIIHVLAHSCFGYDG